MATLVLQAAGAYLGGLFGAFGATVGTAAGALGGYLIDRALLTGSQSREGPRLSGMQPLTGEDGAPLARVYGSARVGGTLIWATRFQEVSTTERQGAKGGPKLTTFSYFGNFVIAICEGEIACLRRIWADGKELDLEDVTIRLYRGTADQLPDPLIEAKQGTGNAPAYRGTAYAVFDRFPLENFGNRIPQFSFEVLRPVSSLNAKIKAVTLIPGSTEYGYAPLPVTRQVQEGETVSQNRHVLHGATDWAASIDELQALCPNLESVALVVTWFGNDLRCGNCTVKPGVATRDAAGLSAAWRVSDATRADAHLVSSYQGGPSFGGTPDDQSVIDAIRDLKARGLKVTLYPFVMMDIAAGNALPNPYGGTGQASYPWRGEITCHPAAGVAGSVDKTAAAGGQAAAFFGTENAAQFSSAGDLVHFAGGADWAYRRFILHYAKLAAVAGGVDGFLLGSELRGLTRIRSSADAFPSVSALVSLASQVRFILGSAPKLTYGADWSEYFGYHPTDASGDMFFNLDPLWASPHISAIGIDNYMPLADWRDEDWLGGNPDGAKSADDLTALSAAIGAGEGFDWFYGSDAARAGRIRSPITDGAAGKPWVFRHKDIRSWWENPHFDRRAGAELTTASAWQPRSKPIWFTEIGCAAVDKGANQPNVFSDPKSSSSSRPHFSNGGRSDLTQQRFLTAHLNHWTGADNPVSPVYGAPMLDISNLHLWAWDARPFPAFPLQSSVWSDGGNWVAGHWLNGRLSGMPLSDLIAAILSDHGVSGAETVEADGFLEGYVVDAPTTARAALEPLVNVWPIDVSEENGNLQFRSRSRAPDAPHLIAETIYPEGEGPLVTKLIELATIPRETTLVFRHPLRDYQAATVTARVEAGDAGTESFDIPAMLDPGMADALVRGLHRERFTARKQIIVSAPWREAALAAGDHVALADLPGETFRVMHIEDGAHRRIEAISVAALYPHAVQSDLPAASEYQGGISGPPLFHLIDLPLLPGESDPAKCFRLAVWSKPWRSEAVFVSPSSDGFVQRGVVNAPAVAGVLVNALSAGETGRFDLENKVTLRLRSGELSSAADIQLFSGANTILVQSASGAWEVLQFRSASEVSANVWELTGLLRAQLGTEDAMNAGAPAGAAFVALNGAVPAAGLSSNETGIDLHWKVGPAGKDFTPQYFGEKIAAGGIRALMPLAPAHLKKRALAIGDLEFSWIRRSRVDADTWLSSDIPLGEAAESWRMRLLTAENTVVREASSSSAQWLWTQAMQAADAPMLPAKLEVSQISEAVGAGVPAVLSL
jgi:GTA TIM-barrel-like domain/Putative phage tail protein